MVLRARIFRAFFVFRRRCSLNAFILDGTINSRTDLGLRITQVPVIPTSERVIESIEVDGREGDLTLLKGWNDMTGSVAKF